MFGKPDSPPNTLHLSPDVLEDLSLATPTGQLLEIKPYIDSNKKIEDNIEMFRAFHSPSSVWRVNTSPTNSYEIWDDGEQIRFMLYVGDPGETRRAIRHISANFPSCRIEVPKEASLSQKSFAKINEGDYVAGCNFHLKLHFYAPLRNPYGVEEFIDPYRNIIAEMAGSENVREFIQILFRPAQNGWTSSSFSDVGTFADDFAESRRVQFTTIGEGEQETDAPEEGKKAMSNIKRQFNQPGFYVSIRIVAFSDDPTAAIEQVKDLANSFKQYYREWTDQQLIPQYKDGYELEELLYDVLSRHGDHMDWPTPITRWKRDRRGTCETLIMTIPELAGLAHIPNGESINNNGAVDWERLDSSNQLPAKAPRYEEYQINAPEAERIPVRNQALDFQTDQETDDEDEDGGTTPPPDDDDTPGDTPTSTSEDTEEPQEIPTEVSTEIPTEVPDEEPTNDTKSSEKTESEPVQSTLSESTAPKELTEEEREQEDWYNIAKDNQYYRTGYKEDGVGDDWTGGQAREEDENGDFDEYAEKFTEKQKQKRREKQQQDENEEKHASLRESIQKGLMENEGTPPTVVDKLGQDSHDTPNDANTTDSTETSGKGKQETTEQTDTQNTNRPTGDVHGLPSWGISPDDDSDDSTKEPQND